MILEDGQHCGKVLNPQRTSGVSPQTSYVSVSGLVY